MRKQRTSASPTTSTTLRAVQPENPKTRTQGLVAYVIGDVTPTEYHKRLKKARKDCLALVGEAQVRNMHRAIKTNGPRRLRYWNGVSTILERTFGDDYAEHHLHLSREIILACVAHLDDKAEKEARKETRDAERQRTPQFRNATGRLKASTA